MIERSKSNINKMEMATEIYNNLLSRRNAYKELEYTVNGKDIKIAVIEEKYLAAIEIKSNKIILLSDSLKVYDNHDVVNNFVYDLFKNTRSFEDIVVDFIEGIFNKEKK